MLLELFRDCCFENTRVTFGAWLKLGGTAVRFVPEEVGLRLVGESPSSHHSISHYEIRAFASRNEVKFNV